MEMPDLNYAHWILQTVAMLLTCFLLPRLEVSGPIPAFLTVAVLAFLNAHLWDTALFLKVPDTATTKALLLILANGALFWVVVKILPGISISGIIPAVIAPIIFTAFNILIEKYGGDIDWKALLKAGLDTLADLRSYFDGRARKETSLSTELFNMLRG